MKEKDDLVMVGNRASLSLPLFFLQLGWEAKILFKHDSWHDAC